VEHIYNSVPLLQTGHMQVLQNGGQGGAMQEGTPCSLKELHEALEWRERVQTQQEVRESPRYVLQEAGLQERLWLQIPPKGEISANQTRDNSLRPGINVSTDSTAIKDNRRTSVTGCHGQWHHHHGRCLPHNHHHQLSPSSHPPQMLSLF
jgi:hypothetical protein